VRTESPRTRACPSARTYTRTHHARLHIHPQDARARTLARAHVSAVIAAPRTYPLSLPPRPCVRCRCCQPTLKALFHTTQTLTRLVLSFHCPCAERPTPRPPTAAQCRPRLPQLHRRLCQHLHPRLPPSLHRYLLLPPRRRRRRRLERLPQPQTPLKSCSRIRRRSRGAASLNRTSLGG